MKTISVLIPTFNEEDNVTEIAEAVLNQLEKLPQYEYNLTFIDNDSQDDTRNKIRELCENDSRIRAIFNAKNYGQFNSPYYGILQAEGDCVITMCADFQDPPEMIPKYVSAWEEGYKIVLGQKTSSKENRLIYWARNTYYKFMKKHSDIDYLKHVTGSGLYDREFIEVMRKVEDSRPFLRGIVAEMGYNIKLIPYEQPKRRAGKSSNNLFKYYDGAMQSITAYTKFAVRLATVIGTLMIAGTLITMAGLTVYGLLHANPSYVVSYAIDLFILLGVSLQIFFIGIVGEYVMDVNIQVRKRPLVIESERINFK